MKEDSFIVYDGLQQVKCAQISYLFCIQKFLSRMHECQIPMMFQMHFLSSFIIEQPKQLRLLIQYFNISHSIYHVSFNSYRNASNYFDMKHFLFDIKRNITILSLIKVACVQECY